MRTQRMAHHAALESDHLTNHDTHYHPNAPCGLNARRRLGNVKETTKLNSQVVAVARDMPSSRMYRGYTSAEYVNGTGPSPEE